MDSVGDGKYLMYWKVFDVSQVVDSVGDGKYLMYLMLWIVLVMESI